MNWLLSCGAATAHRRRDPTRAVLVVTSMIVLGGAGPTLAGPCTGDILTLQAKVDASIDKTAGTGDTAKQSTSAQLHRQPTPQSIAQAESKAGDAPTGDKALAALAAARKADEAGDSKACSAAVAEVKKELGM